MTPALWSSTSTTAVASAASNTTVTADRHGDLARRGGCGGFVGCDDFVSAACAGRGAGERGSGWGATSVADAAA